MKKEIEATIGLNKFQNELKAFLDLHQLQTTLVEKDWTKFMRQYASVIEDCPLTLNLKHIKQVTVHREDAREKIGPNKELELFRIRWVSHGKDGKTGDIEIYHTVP